MQNKAYSVEIGRTISKQEYGTCVIWAPNIREARRLAQEKVEALEDTSFWDPIPLSAIESDEEAEAWRIFMPVKLWSDEEQCQSPDEIEEDNVLGDPPAEPVVLAAWQVDYAQVWSDGALLFALGEPGNEGPTFDPTDLADCRAGNHDHPNDQRNCRVCGQPQEE